MVLNFLSCKELHDKNLMTFTLRATAFFSLPSVENLGVVALAFQGSVNSTGKP